MANKTSYSTLKSAAATVNAMLTNGFGVVTVCNARIYDFDEAGFISVKSKTFAESKVDEIIDYYEAGSVKYEKALVYLKTLKVATATTEGPTKTVTGGQYANTLIKFGKTARLEIQDALGTAAGLAAMTGAIIEDFDPSSTVNVHPYALNEELSTAVVHFGSNFAGPKTIIGDTFFIDQKTGAQVKLRIIFYQVNPDSTFTLTQDSEGDATVFDMNGDLLTTDVLVGTNGEASGDITQGLFFSVVPALWLATAGGTPTADRSVLVDEGTDATTTQFTVSGTTITFPTIGSVAYVMLESTTGGSTTYTLKTGDDDILPTDSGTYVYKAFTANDVLISSYTHTVE